MLAAIRDQLPTELTVLPDVEVLVTAGEPPAVRCPTSSSPARPARPRIPPGWRRPMSWLPLRCALRHRGRDGDIVKSAMSGSWAMTARATWESRRLCRATHRGQAQLTRPAGHCGRSDGPGLDRVVDRTLFGVFQNPLASNHSERGASASRLLDVPILFLPPTLFSTCPSGQGPSDERYGQRAQAWAAGRCLERGGVGQSEGVAPSTHHRAR